jgi:outer membrane cobalamin receptor
MMGVALMLVAGVFGCAGSREHEAERYQNLTGSYVPQDVQRNGPVSNGKSDVRVIDRSDIDKSGGTDVQQTLRQLGVR